MIEEIQQEIKILKLKLRKLYKNANTNPNYILNRMGVEGEIKGLEKALKIISTKRR